MFSKIKKFVFVAGLVLSMVLPAFAWDETGHKIVAWIAWQRMTPDVRAKVIKTLLAAPEDAQLSTFYMPYGSQSQEARQRDFFVLIATWADMIKDKNFDARYKKYNHSNWHYYDTVWMEKGGKVEFLPAPADGGMLMDKLAEFDKVVRGTASNSDKAVAIAWLEHLIGDLHQPLHTTAHAFGPDDKGDQGGNLFSLTPKGSPSGQSDNLHRFWDGVIGRNIPNSSDACDDTYLEPIVGKITKDYPYEKLQERLASGKYEVWEKESIDIATTAVYKGVKRNEAPSDDYKKKALKIAEERMALAGYRLADLFNSAFGSAPPAQAPAPGSN